MGVYAYFSTVKQSALVLLLLVPYGVIWFVALYGAMRLRTYVRTIVKTPDGIGFARIDLGLFILLLALVLPAVLGSISGLFSSSSEPAVPLTILITTTPMLSSRSSHLQSSMSGR